jgi:hypothetical protein
VPAISASPFDPPAALPAGPGFTPPAESYPNVPAQRDDPARRGRRGKLDECAQLRAECEQLREIAASAQASATQAALDAQATHAEFLTAQFAADEARRACDLISRQLAEVAAETAALDRSGAPSSEKLQAETSHAAFAAYRRGDISSEQLREVFKRAEGWTPEHDRLSRRTTELRSEETEAIRRRESAQQAVEEASERARAAAITARALDDQARTAALDARGRCAAADACEQRRR